MDFTAIVRQVLISQGFPADAIDAGGKVNAIAIASHLFDTVELRTRATPPITMSIREALTAPPSPVVQWLKPTIILRGRAGTFVVAPYGQSEGSWLPLVSIGALSVVGLWYAFA